MQNSEFIASAAAPARPNPQGLPPAMGQREEQGLEGTENYRGGAQRWQTRGRGCCRHLGTPRHLAGTFLL